MTDNTSMQKASSHGPNRRALLRTNGRRFRKTTWVAGGVLLLAAPLGATTAASAAPVPPFDLLPTAVAPTTVPYSIGTTVYYGGKGYDLSRAFDPALKGNDRQFLKVAATRGVVVTQHSYSAADVVNVVGRFSPSLNYAGLETNLGGLSTFDVTLGGLAAMPENGQVRNATNGRVYAAWTRQTAGCSGSSIAPAAVGYRVLQRETSWSSCPPGMDAQGAFLWYPPSAVQQLADTMEAVGRLGTGWLGDHTSATGWSILPASNPSAAPKQVASMMRPLVNGDGTKAVVVQSGRVRVISPATMSNLATSLPTIGGWSVGVRDAVPAAWETNDLFLVTARYDGTLALVRCSASTGKCWRVVRTSVRTGVTRIITERGATWAGTYVQ